MGTATSGNVERGNGENGVSPAWLRGEEHRHTIDTTEYRFCSTVVVWMEW